MMGLWCAGFGKCCPLVEPWSHNTLLIIHPIEERGGEKRGKEMGGEGRRGEERGGEESRA